MLQQCPLAVQNKVINQLVVIVVIRILIEYLLSLLTMRTGLLLLAVSRAASFKHNTSALSMMSSAADGYLPDPVYPGTAVERLTNIRERVKGISQAELNQDWDSVRRLILWAGGLRDLPDARPGMGYTGHSFNDYNHCDLTAMLASFSDSTNDGRVEGIQQQNFLGKGIQIASLPELGPGGSWSTCMIGTYAFIIIHMRYRSII
jgi:hypothetical protein